MRTCLEITVGSTSGAGERWSQTPSTPPCHPTTSQTCQVALKACADGGRIVLVGMGQEEMTVGLTEACIREVDIVGSFRWARGRQAGRTRSDDASAG